LPSPTGAETYGAAFNGGRNDPRKNLKIKNVKILNEAKATRKRGGQHCGDQNAKDACHNSLLLGADCSVVNRSSHRSGTSSNPQRKPQTGRRQ